MVGQVNPRAAPDLIPLIPMATPSELYVGVEVMLSFRVQSFTALRVEGDTSRNNAFRTFLFLSREGPTDSTSMGRKTSTRTSMHYITFWRVIPHRGG